MNKKCYLKFLNYFFLIVILDQFFLVDVEYMFRLGFIIPYQIASYHLKEYFQHPHENPKELFNLRHSLLHNAIERDFSILKSRFLIIIKMSRYDVDKVCEIVLTCCILHNFLMDFDLDEEIITLVDKDLMNSELERNLVMDELLGVKMDGGGKL